MTQFNPKLTTPEFLETDCLVNLALPFETKTYAPKTILEINDAKIRDHLIETNQDEISSRYRRFLQEITDGKRHYLRDAAWPELQTLSSIPLARPLFLPRVTVTFAPGDLDFKIMTTQAQKSKTPQDPTVTFEAELIESKVRSIGAYVDMDSEKLLNTSGKKGKKRVAASETSLGANLEPFGDWDLINNGNFEELFERSLNFSLLWTDAKKENTRLTKDTKELKRNHKAEVENAQKEAKDHREPR
uniref:Uncharacterized protein n=1 Tax=Cannabis sativa TaxID=3483 RepID=A0A803P4G3_CANSA